MPFFQFLLTLLMFPFIGFVVLKIFGMMLGQEIDVISGILALGGVVGMFVMAVSAQSDGVSLGIFLCMVVLAALYPYAVTQLSRAEFHMIDVEGLERCFATIAERPQTIPSYFELAQRLYDLGLSGHAIAIAERTVNSLSTDMDPSRNASMRDIFRKEESRLKQWKRETPRPREFEPIRCPNCGNVNPVGEIRCAKCGSPYLLLHFRGTNMRQRTMSRLILAYGVITVSICGCVASLAMLGGAVGAIAFVLAIACCALVLFLLFRGEIRSYDRVVDV